MLLKKAGPFHPCPSLPRLPHSLELILALLGIHIALKKTANQGIIEWAGSGRDLKVHLVPTDPGQRQCSLDFSELHPI